MRGGGGPKICPILYDADRESKNEKKMFVDVIRTLPRRMGAPWLRQPTHSLPLSTFIGSLSSPPSLPLSSSLFFLPLSTIISLGLNREEPLHAGREKSQPDNRHAVGEQTWMMTKDQNIEQRKRLRMWLLFLECQAWICWAPAYPGFT